MAAHARADLGYRSLTLTIRRAVAADAEAIGSQFMDQAKAQRPDGFELWTLLVNSGARQFYERHGL